MGTPPPFGEAEIERSELRRVLRAIDVRLVPDFLERRLDDELARLVAGDERFRHVLALVERGGWFAADRFVRWIRERLDAAAPDGTPRALGAATLAQLHAATGVELTVVASDTTDARLLVLNHRTAPDCPVVWAVRMSMSIPLVWDEVLWRAEWGPYLGRDVAGHAVVDGGVLSNFPIELFVSAEPEVERLMGPKRGTPVLGLLVDEQLAVPPPLASARGALVSVRLDPSELRVVERLRRLVDTATTAHDKMVMEEHEALVVHLPARGYGTTEFDMSDARRAALVGAGRAAMAAYLDRAAAPRARAAVSRAEGPARSDRIARKLLELDAAPEG
jgi:predicted acylesterase/phospholipase RssA